MKSNTKNIAIVFLAATTLGLGVQLYSTQQKLKGALQAPALQVKRSEISVAAAPSPIVAPAAAPVAPAAEPAQENNFGPPEGGPGQGGPGNFGNRGGRGFGAQMAELMKDPEFAAAMKLEQEARIEQRYGALFKQLNLPAEKIAELKSMLAERENAMRDVMASAASQGLNPRESRDELRQLAADMQAEVDNSIKTTFGDNVLNSLNTYNNNAPQRATINDLSQKLVYSSQPLNDTQSQMLTTILAETGQQNGRTTLVTDATIARAQGVLMPSQVEALKKLQSEQQAQQLLQTKMREAREAAQAQRNANRQNRNNNGGQ